MVPDRPLVIVSNRGPLSFRIDDAGELIARRGAGGLVSGIGPLISGTDATWIAAAISDGDRIAAGQGVLETEGFRVQLLDIDVDRYRAYYDVVCNGTLWFVHHGLYDLPRRPRFDHRWHEAWEQYREVNRQFADAVAESAPHGAIVLVQDYHLCLLATTLVSRRDDLELVHFSHTPFAGPDQIAVLPDAIARELLAGMVAHRACGFHTQRWRDAFDASCRSVLGEESGTFVAPLATDREDIERVASSAACNDALAELDRELGDRLLIARVDRIELSKNLLRGFHAFDELLERYPEHRERVVFGAFVYPSREGLAEYLAYRQEVESLVRSLQEKWGTDTWSPILLDTSDDFPRSVAALRRYDALLVNPIRDGLNLVATEGALVNERAGVMLLSTEAGAWAQLEGAALGLNPYDIRATADALADALSWTPDQRHAHAASVKALAAARTPRDWLDDLLGAAGGG